MTDRAIFLTHAEVQIDPDVPVPDWGLSEQGRTRHARFATSDDCAPVTMLFCSDERKARDGAEITSKAIGVAPVIRPLLGENDRSATGYLPKLEFEAMADAFFARPDEAVNGWERACDAQARIVAAVAEALAEPRPEGDVLFVSHGGVSALLRCHLLGIPITRAQDQPAGGGCWFSFAPDLTSPPTEWRVI
ncbi:histidine phosphatase family protein [Cognatishimia sp. MH4019]|uniref:histidine phosphatase family protein n=1 Tax=Cognatishimia sp. MH4019 TaxID=2854030 RepID=UPI001CD7CA78|nr:histidine phosphatase family protein [Cognatishimia sp. MH4019]